MPTRPSHLRRGLGVTAAAALALPVLATGAAAQEPDDQDLPFDRGFSDVCTGDEDHGFDDVDGSVHEAAIACAAELQIAQGRDATTYHPGGDVTREQMASFIVRTVEGTTGDTLDAGDPDEFEDSDDIADAHRDNVGKLVEAGIATGTLQGDFEPKEPVGRDQMATFLRRALSFIDDGQAEPASAPPAYTGSPYFEDEPLVTVHRDNIQALGQVGVVTGDADGNYDPAGTVRRDQMATFLLRAADYAVSPGFPGVDRGDAAEAATIDQARVELDVLDSDGDAETASEGDGWELTFSRDLADAEGATIVVLDPDEELHVVECVDPDGDGTTETDGAVAALCDVDDATLLVLLTADLAVDGDAAAYPLAITDTDVRTADGGIVDLAGSDDLSIETDDDTVTAEEPGAPGDDGSLLDPLLDLLPFP